MGVDNYRVFMSRTESSSDKINCKGFIKQNVGVDFLHLTFYKEDYINIRFHFGLVLNL